jgi:hypothetical protein
MRISDPPTASHRLNRVVEGRGIVVAHEGLVEHRFLREGEDDEESRFLLYGCFRIASHHVYHIYELTGIDWVTSLQREVAVFCEDELGYGLDLLFVGEANGVGDSGVKDGFDFSCWVVLGGDERSGVGGCAYQVSVLGNLGKTSWRYLPCLFVYGEDGLVRRAGQVLSRAGGDFNGRVGSGVDGVDIPSVGVLGLLREVAVIEGADAFGGVGQRVPSEAGRGVTGLHDFYTPVLMMVEMAEKMKSLQFAAGATKPR